ncbi:MAG: hypothetical protein ACM3VZ_02470 [Acidobacteriota bacterium]
MQLNDLESEYERLCEELEEAYAASEWNSGEIDRIANAIARIEHASMRRSALAEPLLMSKASHMHELDMSRA